MQTPRTNVATNSNANDSSNSDNAEKIILGAAFSVLLATCAYMIYNARSERKLFE